MNGSFKIQPLHLVSAMGLAVGGIFVSQFFAISTEFMAAVAGVSIGGSMVAARHYRQLNDKAQREQRQLKKRNKKLQDALDVQIYEADALRHTLKEIGFEMHSAMDRDLSHMGDVIENILDNHLSEVALTEDMPQSEMSEGDNVILFNEERANHVDMMGMAEFDLSSKELAEHLDYALENKKIDVFAQPVVSLPSRHIIGYELFSRIWADGQGQIPASAYLDVAQRHEKLPDIDNALLIKAMLLTRKFQENTHCQAFFINLSPLTLHDAQFMAEMVAFLTRYRVLAPNLVFEMPQSAYQNLTERQKKNIHALGKAGCRFSMDQVWHFDMELRDLSDLHIAFIKTEAQDVVAEIQGRKGFRKMQEFHQKLTARDISWVIEKIEDEKDLLDVLDLEISYGQGYLFEEPQPLKDMMDHLTKMAANS